MKATITDTLLSSLKRYNPSKVRAFTSDDEYRDIAVPTRRKKWSQVIAAVEARSWSRVEMLDRSGAVLGYVENTGPALDLEDIGGGGGAVKEAERIVALVLRGQQSVMAMRDAETQALLKAQGDVVRSMTEGMRALTELYSEQVEAAENLAETRAIAAATPDKGELQQLLDAAPVILQVLPMLKQLLGSDPSPPNGVKSKTS